MDEALRRLRLLRHTSALLDFGGADQEDLAAAASHATAAVNALGPPSSAAANRPTVEAARLLSGAAAEGGTLLELLGLCSAAVRLREQSSTGGSGLLYSRLGASKRCRLQRLEGEQARERRSWERRHPVQRWRLTARACAVSGSDTGGLELAAVKLNAAGLGARATHMEHCPAQVLISAKQLHNCHTY